MPYGEELDEVPSRIRYGEPPSRPTDQSQNQWLQDPVWDVITTGWSYRPKERCELSVLRDTFATASQWRVYSGDLTNQTDRNLTGQEQRGKFLQQIAAFYKAQSQNSRGRLMK